MVPFQATKPSAHQRTTDPLQAQSVRCAVLSPHRAIITWRDGERIENPKKAPVDQPTHTRRGTGNAPGSHRLQAHAVPTHAQYKSGTDRHPVLTNVTPRPRRRPAVPTIKALASVPSAAPHQQRSTARLHMPSPGGQASGMAGHKNRCGWAWAGRVWHPVGLPKGYYTAPPGQSCTALLPVASSAATGAPRGRTPSSRQDAARTPACKIDEPPPREGA